MEEMKMPPAKAGSIENMLHHNNDDGFLLFTKALHPLHSHPDRKKLPETFPFEV